MSTKERKNVKVKEAWQTKEDATIRSDGARIYGKLLNISLPYSLSEELAKAAKDRGFRQSKVVIDAVDAEVWSEQDYAPTTRKWNNGKALVVLFPRSLFRMLELRAAQKKVPKNRIVEVALAKHLKVTIE